MRSTVPMHHTVAAFMWMMWMMPTMPHRYTTPLMYTMNDMGLLITGTLLPGEMMQMHSQIVLCVCFSDQQCFLHASADE
jgi:hypothetical protein